MYIDYEQNMMRTYNGLHPTSVHGRNNINNLYQTRYLVNKIYSRFKFMLPEEFDLNTFRFMTLIFGNIAIFEKGNRTFFSPFSIDSYNIYYNPYEVSSRPLTEQNMVIDDLAVSKAVVNKDAVIIKAFDDYRGFLDIVTDYAESLASFDKAIKTALLNSNVNLVGFADNKKQAEEIKTAYAKATEGEPLVIMDKGFTPEDREKLLIPFTNHDTASIVDKLLTSRRAVVNNFLTEIGIENANINKKERLNSDEVNANDDEVESIINVVFENLKDSFDKANEVFGLNMKVELNEPKEPKELLDRYNNLKEGGGLDVS